MKKKFRLISLVADDGKQVRVTGIKNSQGTDSEELTTGSSQLIVTTLEVVDVGLGQHGVVLQLGLSQDWGVGRDDNQLGLTLSDSLDGGLESQGVLS